jgi:hypothetical protein
MPIEIGIWRLGASLQRVKMQSLDLESKLENSLCKDLSILAPNLLLIGRQVRTPFGKFIDMLAMDVEGNLTVIELKRNKTPREVVAQVLDYASWVQDLSRKDVTDLYAEKNEGEAFEKGFSNVFDSIPPSKLNERHELVIVAAELDPATERIIGYLAENHGVPINAVFFQYFKEGDAEFLTRTWLIDPHEVEKKTSDSPKGTKSEPWNGQDYYVCFGDGTAEGEGTYRSWDDARRYGYVAAGGGPFYNKPMENLSIGNRVFVHVPKNGYVAVGEVLEPAVPATDFVVGVNGQDVPFFEAPLELDYAEARRNANDPEKREMMVRVKWEKAVPKEQAYWEKGLFASTLPACKLRNQFTLQRLVEHFGLEE